MNRAFIKYIAGLLLFGLNGVVASYIGLNSYEIVLTRSLLGSVLLVGIFFAAGNRLTVFRYKRDLFFIALSGIMMGADWLFLFEAYKHIGVSLSLIINYVGPVIVMALSPLIFKEQVTLPKLIALALAFLGVLLIGGQAVMVDINPWGLTCAGLSAVSYAGMVIFNKLAHGVSGLENATLQLVLTALTVTAFVGIKEGFSFEIAGEDWIPVLVLGLINTGLGCYLYFSSLSDLPVQTVAICGYLEPLSAVIFSAVFLREKLLPLQILGVALIIGGALFAELNKKNPLRLLTGLGK